MKISHLFAVLHVVVNIERTGGVVDVDLQILVAEDVLRLAEYLMRHVGLEDYLRVVDI